MYEASKHRNQTASHCGKKPLEKDTDSLKDWSSLFVFVQVLAPHHNACLSGDSVIPALHPWLPLCHTLHVSQEPYPKIMSSPMTYKCTCLTSCLAINLALYPSDRVLIYLLTCPPLWWQSVFPSSFVQKSLWQITNLYLWVSHQPHRGTLCTSANSHGFT